MLVAGWIWTVVFNVLAAALWFIVTVKLNWRKFTKLLKSWEVERSDLTSRSLKTETRSSDIEEKRRKNSTLKKRRYSKWNECKIRRLQQDFVLTEMKSAVCFFKEKKKKNISVFFSSRKWKTWNLHHHRHHHHHCQLGAFGLFPGCLLVFFKGSAGSVCQRGWRAQRASCWTTRSAFIQNKPDIFL